MADWKEQLPESMRSDPSLKDFSSVEALAKSFVETKGFLGNAIRIPGSDASESARKEFLSKLVERVPELVPLPADDAKLAEVEDAVMRRFGRAKEPKEYVPPKVDVEMSEQELNTLRDIAMKRGYTKKQFNTLVSDAAGEKLQRMQKAAEKKDELKRHLGLATADRLASFAGLAETTGAPAGLVEAIKNGDIDVPLARWLGSLAEKLTQAPGAAGGRGGSQGNVLTPEEAMAQISDIRRDPDYFQPKDRARHEFLRQKMERLMAFAFPDDAKSQAQ